MKKFNVLISILNWNKAAQTLACIESLKPEVGAKHGFTLLVIDNASSADDFDQLEKSQARQYFQLQRLSENLGFTGGQNIAIKKAIDENFDFIWLVNNDVIVAPSTSLRLLAFMDNHERCGVVSPVIRASDDNNSVEACVNKFNWASRTFSRATDVTEGKRMQSESAALIWVAGTAALYRVSALQEIGLLDEPMFAYFDDPDVCARLATRGWSSRCAFDTAVVHDSKGKFENLPLYCFYLSQRNEMRFWIKNMPRSGRKLLWIKVLDKAFFEVNRLYRNGLIAQGDAALLGIAAFLQQRFGAPVLNWEVPYAIRLACKLSQFIYRKKLRFHRPAID